ncbi:LptF/LptG family permease [Pseudanabaena mucicola]|uniref:LptF/LptG family permease n=1 Tax=Pseudanabaena mucicola FACHB-723 TaxID=2692860 RepID=A0ABR7ZT92_9CYAN|nr:LptF/LptG family permease [Pseudanabaena mucicola]MBD2186962.1 LptF/LptG family permease [Pseudanabaena mucicola FACHB-723]
MTTSPTTHTRKKSTNVSLGWLPRLSIMDRYLIIQMLVPFLFGVGAFSSVILAIGSLFELIRLITDAGLSVLVALQIFGYQVPGFMVYSFPMSMLLATLLSYSRMSGDGETTALRSCGVSAYRLVLPALVLSLFVTGLTYVFNEAIVPAANWQSRSTLRAALNQENVQFKSQDIFYQQYGEVPQEDGSKKQGLVRSFYARSFDGKEMRGLTVLDFSQGQLQQILAAESAIWLPDQNVWRFTKGTTYLVGPDGNYRSILRFDDQNLQLPRAPLDLAQEQRSAEEMNIADIRRNIELLKQSGNTKEIRKLEVRLEQKYALPFICVVFAIVGASLGMRPQRTGAAIGFGLSVLIIFGYYLLLFICGALGQVEFLSPIAAAWMPNLIGLTAGVVILTRVT